MTDKINMSLDDIIKNNRKPNNLSASRNLRSGPVRQNAGKQNNNGPQRSGAGPIKAGNFNRQNRRQSGPYTRVSITFFNISNQLECFLFFAFLNQFHFLTVSLSFRSQPTQVTQSNGNNRWPHDKFEGQSVSKINLSNLHYRVSDQDLLDLFSEFGKIKNANVFYDKTGRSLGNAQVVFMNHASAVAAKKKYNGILLDGKFISIEFNSSLDIVFD